MSELLKQALRTANLWHVEETKKQVMGMEIKEEYKAEAIDILIERFQMIIEMLIELKKELEE